MKYFWLSLIILSACPALQTRNEIKTREGRGGVIQETEGAKEAAQEQEVLAEIRRLNGKIEELTFKVEELERKADTTAIENRVDRLEDKILSYGESLILLDKKITGQSTSNIRSAGRSAKKDLGPYDKAERLFRNSDWKSAILEYNNYRDNFPKGKHYADATYKIGVSFQEMGMTSEARAFFNEVVEKFPQSKPAKSAKYRLNQLKK